jgi:methanogenic corrinoid protein MtbC1
MYRIGLLWETNQITVAEEHFATAIVGRVMADLYPRFAQYTITRGKVIVSAGPNEFHWIGARMVADFMEMAGWDVNFLGPNTPADALIDMLKRQKPFMVALSVATVFNLDNAQKVVRMIKEDLETKDIKVLVGGLAFNSMPELWQNIGADGYAADAGSLIPLSDEWWLARNE